MKFFYCIFLIVVTCSCDSMGVRQTGRSVERLKILENKILEAQACYVQKKPVTLSIMFLVYNKHKSSYFSMLFNQVNIDGAIDSNPNNIWISVEGGDDVKLSGDEKSCISKVFSGLKVPMLYFTNDATEKQRDRFLFNLK